MARSPTINGLKGKVKKSDILNFENGRI